MKILHDISYMCNLKNIKTRDHNKKEEDSQI